LEQNMRKLAIAASAVGVVLVIAAVVVRYAVAPAVIKLPSDTNLTRSYGGTATALLNPAALASGSTTNVLLHNVPIVASHTTKVLKSNSDNALIADTHALTAAGAPVSSSTFQYAVNRKTMERGSGFSGVTQQTGLTFNFPIHTQKHNYTGWVADTGQTTPLTYAGTGKRGGVSVYKFNVNSTPAPLTDPHQLANLPKTLPKAALPTLAAANGISPTLLAGAQALIAALPANIPLAYTYQVKGTLYAAPTSGVVVDLAEHEVRSVTLAGVGGLPALPIVDISFVSTPASLKAAANDANNKDDTIDLLYSWLPWGLGIGGAVLLVIGLVGILVGRRRDNEPLTSTPSGSTIPTPRETPTDKPAPTDT
jgi:hypothetical protein